MRHLNMKDNLIIQKILILAAIYIGIFAKLTAQSQGGFIEYKYVGNQQYKILAHVYRDCNANPLDSVEIGILLGKDPANRCLTKKLKNNRIEIKDITPSCRTIPKPCNPQNTKVNAVGIEQHIFEAMIDLNESDIKTTLQNSNCCDITFYLNAGKRSTHITNLASVEDMALSSGLNYCEISNTNKGYNNSALKLSYLRSIACVNQPFYFSSQFTDTVDKDSISFKSAQPTSSNAGTVVNYASTKFDVNYPISVYCGVSGNNNNCTPNPNAKPPRGFFFDANLGEMVFTPLKPNEYAVIKYTVYEYRKIQGLYKQIGYTDFECTIFVDTTCGYNNAPTIEGPQNNSVCEGDKICFRILSKDEPFQPYQTIADTVRLQWNRGIPGASFTILNPIAREKQAEFCWQTLIGQARDMAYSFSATATDNHCPQAGISARTFSIKVTTKPGIDRKISLAGNILFFEPLKFRGTDTPYTVRWSVRDENNAEIYSSLKRKDSMQLANQGKYTVISTVNGKSNCPTIYRDTFIFYGLGISHKALSKSVQVYPNPAQLYLRLKLPDQVHVLSVQILDMQGKLLRQLPYQQQICVAELSPGAYLLQCNTNLGKVQKAFSIQR